MYSLFLKASANAAVMIPKLTQMMSGIVMAGADALNKLPKTGEGRPIIK